MKFLADENIPASLVRVLADDYHDVVEVRAKAPGISDMEVMRIAHEESRIILTFDKDFGELAVKQKAVPCRGVILLRIPKKSPDQIAEYVKNVIQSRDDWEGHMSVIEEERVRMRPL
jgi:predicted nuclease of predicted toxin-antitoxin system